MNSRERVLEMLQGRQVDRIPCYSGMGNVTLAGLEQYGYRFCDVHSNAGMMADAAASSYKLFGYECAVAPFDLCVEAEAVGCSINDYEAVNAILYPTIREKISEDLDQLLAYPLPADVASRGRVPLVCEALRLLRQDIGAEVAIGAYVLGPYTLAGQLTDLDKLFKLTYKKPDLVNAVLDRLADVTIAVAGAYRAAGADYLCIREMGATTDVLGPRLFDKTISPHLKKVSAACGNFPTILHICGGTNKIVKEMHGVGCSAISVEAKNDLHKSRADIGQEALIFGNVDSYNVLANGSPEEVEQSVLRSIEGGVDAVWPSCDIWPTAPLANLTAMVETVKKYGLEKWVRRAV